jgi:hypothetical protein
MSADARHRLSSWKEIATYLGREVRTVIRWEKERGLPIHRVPGGQGRSVFAYTDELDRWSAGDAGKAATAIPSAAASGQPSRRIALVIAAGAIIVVAAVVVVLGGGWPQRELTDVVVQTDTIEGLDKAGRAVWSYQLPGRAVSVNRPLTHITELTGDRRPDAIVSTIEIQPPSDVGSGFLYALDSAGKPLWERELKERLTFAAGDFDPPWLPDNVTPFTSGGEPLIAWAVHHLTWWPSIVAVYDARGSRLGMFVNSGWMRITRPSADGRHIVAGGFSNSRNGAAFAVLDARKPDGASPEDPGSPFECRSCPAGRPLRYFVVDWSDIASSLPPDDRDAVVSVHAGTGNIELRAKQRRNAELIVELSPTFEITRRATSDTFWEWHQSLERSGAIAHGRAACPYRDGPIVREWTPSGGWKVHGGSGTR